MAIHVHAQGRTGEEQEKQAHPGETKSEVTAGPVRPREGESQGTGAARQVERRQRLQQPGQVPFTGVRWSAETKVGGISLMHVSVSRPQPGEGKKRTLWQGQLYYTGARGSLLSETPGSAPLPHLTWTGPFFPICCPCQAQF